jgi:hypothetical protein
VAARAGLQKADLIIADELEETLRLDIPHRQRIFVIPKTLLIVF